MGVIEDIGLNEGDVAISNYEIASHHANGVTRDDSGICKFEI